MFKRLFLLSSLSAATILGSSACATQTYPDKYANTSCDTLRALQQSFAHHVSLPTQPALHGVNEIDRNQGNRNILGGGNRDRDKDSIRAAYKKNGC